MIETVAAVERRSIQTKAKQQEHDDAPKKVSNSQLQKQTLIDDGKRKEKQNNQSAVIEV